MTLFIVSLCLFLLSGFAALAASHRPRLATMLGAWGAVIACLVGLVPAMVVLSGGAAVILKKAWAVPYGSFSLAIDALSAFFLLPVFVLSALAAIYGSRYVAKWYGTRPIGAHWLFFNLLAGGMALVVAARNAVLFVTAWEIMSIASFFLVTLENEKEKVRSAGLTYLVATHIGTAFLLAAFVLLGRTSGTLDFEAFGGMSFAASSVIFVLAVIGFGTKAGFVPFHVWLPEAHPAAPSHVSALMSAVMIKMGIYGLVRTLYFLGVPPLWWGCSLVGIGIVSAVIGVLLATAEKDIKRLLAFSSVENAGIIAMGLGVGCIGISQGLPVLAVFGFAGGLLHVVNHSVFKGMLFMAAGSVVEKSGTREIDKMGGILKRMPWTGMAFIVGSAAIAALPPLNGFVSEFLIYLASFQGVFHGHMPVFPCLGVIAVLALVGGLVAVCFTKAAAGIFLGEPRSDNAARAEEVPLAMRAPVLVLAALSIAMGLGSPFILKGMTGVLSCAFVIPPGAEVEGIRNASSCLAGVVAVSAVFLTILMILAVLRKAVLAKRVVSQAGTWDCGYAAPAASMEYTATSFSQPVTWDFRALLKTVRKVTPVKGLFPKKASIETNTPDIFMEDGYGPVWKVVCDLSGKMKRLQHGRLQAYVLYIAVTLLALLIWKLR